MKNGLAKAALPEARKRLVELMQSLNFGRIEDMAVRDGDPVLNHIPFGTRSSDPSCGSLYSGFHSDFGLVVLRVGPGLAVRRDDARVVVQLQQHAAAVVGARQQAVPLPDAHRQVGGAGVGRPHARQRDGAQPGLAGGVPLRAAPAAGATSRPPLPRRRGHASGPGGNQARTITPARSSKNAGSWFESGMTT